MRDGVLTAQRSHRSEHNGHTGKLKEPTGSYRQLLRVRGNGLCHVCIGRVPLVE